MTSSQNALAVLIILVVAFVASESIVREMVRSDVVGEAIESFVGTMAGGHVVESVEMGWVQR